MTQKSGISGFVDKNLWPILCGAFAIYGGYATGQATTQAEINNLRDRVTNAERRIAGRTEIMHCIVRNIDRLYDRSGQHATPACEMRIPQ